MRDETESTTAPAAICSSQTTLNFYGSSRVTTETTSYTGAKEGVVAIARCCGIVRLICTANTARVSYPPATRFDRLTIDPDTDHVVKSLLPPLRRSRLITCLELKTSIESNALRTGNSSPPQLGYRLEPQHERVPNTAHSFFVRFGRTGARCEEYLISIAQQMLSA